MSSLLGNTVVITKATSTTLAEVEAEVIAQTMEANRYNQSKVARILGISRGALRTKLKAAYGDRYIGSRS